MSYEQMFGRIATHPGQQEALIQMDARLVTLKLYLDALGVTPDIDTVSDRKRIQKVVYLAQRLGVDLGYRYGWYLMGPYSPNLTRDYFSLATATAAGDGGWSEYVLHPNIAERLTSVKGRLRRPPDVQISDTDWLEIAASVDYLLRVRKLDWAGVMARLAEQKPRLARYAERARTYLEATVPQ